MPPVDFNDNNSAIVQFKASWAIGRAVQQHLKALSVAADSRFDPNWTQTLAEFSRFVDRFATTAEQDIGVYLSSFQDSVNGWLKLYRGGNKALGQVIDDILGAIRPLKTDELEHHLSEIASEGKKLMELCVSSWGGREAAKRLSEIQNVPVSVVSEAGAKRTWLFADSASRATNISLRMGVGESTLTDYVSLPFYFFHEYLSHVFSAWDDLPGTFSEGFLVKLEEQFFAGKCHTLPGGFASLSDVVLNDVVTDLSDHRTRLIPKRRSDGDYSAAAGRTVPWLQDNLEQDYLNLLLLEIAGIARPHRYGFQQQFISALGYLHRSSRADVLQQIGTSQRLGVEDFLTVLEDKLPEIKELFK